ncbi:MAG: DUF3891 family protein [Actinomycetota bacterium]|nr:DUF3891 family protein [Actinomycetota bacterium]
MIVADADNGQLWLVNQTTHALMAAELCRHWGNRDVEAPRMIEVVLAAIAQHDNGWYEEEARPRLDPDGRPMSFMTGPPWSEKLDLWRRGIRRAFDQHPYAGVLVARHAATLYQPSLSLLSGEELVATREFVEQTQPATTARARELLAGHGSWAELLTDEAIEASTRLLKVGDHVSLRVLVPYAERGVLDHGPVDHRGTTTPLQITHGEGAITIDPWPYGVDSFDVEVWGRKLDRRTFADIASYRDALAAAPLRVRRWRVVPA